MGTVLKVVAIWAFLVVAVIVEGGKIPETKNGWILLICLGPIAYVVLAAFTEGLFSFLFPDKKK